MVVGGDAVITCIYCKLSDAECACEFPPYMVRMQQRLREGFAALAVMSDAEKERIDAAAWERASQVTEEPPSYTRWQRDIEADRMRDGLAHDMTKGSR
jgi:hypothetical protein